LVKPVITFVNHASVIFSYNQVNLITDPWIFGSAFNNSWELVSESKMKIEDFENISHIWFSHEHPDHFSIKVLKSIPTQNRMKITVLFQNTLDHRVANKCKELGFNVIEIKPNESYELAKDFKIICRPYLLYDSWLFLEIGETKILNINDCGVDSHTQARYIHDVVGDVDLILTQFGYAAHIGDPDDSKLRKIASDEKLNRIKIQTEVFNAKYIIPFASFVKFSHIDNYYMNDEMNQISDIEKYIAQKTHAIPIILYPGNKWQIGDGIDNHNAVELYEKDFASEIKLFKESPIISFDELKKLESIYVKNIRERNSWFMIKLLHNLSFFKRAKIYLKDLSIPIIFDLINGIQKSNFQRNNADIITDSDSLAFALKFDYGADTLLANARFRTSGGKTMNFFRLFLIGTLNNNGRRFPFGIIGFLLKEKSMWKTLFVEAILGKYDFK